MKEYVPIIDEWPHISFEEIAHEEVEGKIVGAFYKSFFRVLSFPESLVSSLSKLVKHDQTT